jgi:signal transduction histidine kinase
MTSSAAALAGWPIAAAGLGAAAIMRSRLCRHMEAVARACHELRGPLTAVRLGLELGGRVRQLPYNRLRAIELELERAALALDDLAAAPRRGVIGGGAASGSRGGGEEVDIGELVSDSVEAWRTVARARDVALCLEPASAGLVVAGERLRLAQAIGNLIANAIEHGGGLVEVRVRGEEKRIRVEVVDGGPGLPAPIDELVRRRRRKRRRVDKERGHGLAIASAIATAHGGRLAGAPTERGARVVLELPADRRTTLSEHA